MQLQISGISRNLCRFRFLRIVEALLYNLFSFQASYAVTKPKIHEDKQREMLVFLCVLEGGGQATRARPGQVIP